jgi:hypothetical protein
MNVVRVTPLLGERAHFLLIDTREFVYFLEQQNDGQSNGSAKTFVLEQRISECDLEEDNEQRLNSNELRRRTCFSRNERRCFCLSLALTI